MHTYTKQVYPYKYTCIYLHVDMSAIQLYSYTHMHTHLYIEMSEYIHINTCTCRHICMCINTEICIYTYMYVLNHINRHLHNYGSMCIYTCIHIQIYTHLKYTHVYTWHIKYVCIQGCANVRTDTCQVVVAQAFNSSTRGAETGGYL